MTKEDYEKIVPIIKKHELLVITDEIYAELSYDQKFTSIASFDEIKDQVILISGYSKAYAMTGWRLGYVLANEVKDNDIKFVTVTAVKVTNDLSFAKVYVMVLDMNKKDTTIKALNDAAGFIRSELFDRVDIRHIPELTFVYDESIEYGKKIEDKLKEINKQ